MTITIWIILIFVSWLAAVLNKKGAKTVDAQFKAFLKEFGKLYLKYI